MGNVMKCNLVKKTLNVVMIAMLAMPMVACSKNTSAKKVKKVSETDRRRPKDNVFIKTGGLSKKSKINPFADEEKVSEMPKQDVVPAVAQDKREDKVSEEKVAMLSSPGKAAPKRSFLRVVASKISSFFNGEKSKNIMVASIHGARRPMINDMVVNGKHTPDHGDLMQVEQGSNTDGYAYDWAPIQENVYQTSSNEAILEQLDVGTNAAIINADIALTSNINDKAVVLNKPVKTKHVAAKNFTVINEKKVLEEQLSSAIGDFLSISGSLCGINVEGGVGDDVISIPEIEDKDLRAKNVSAPNLIDIPSIPKELTVKS